MVGYAKGSGLAALALLGALVAVPADPAEAAADQTCDASSYRVAVRSLTGPPRADLTIRITAVTPNCELPGTLSRVQVTIGGWRKLNLSNVPSPSGTATVGLGRVPRLQRVAASITFGSQILVNRTTRTFLKPD